MNEDWEAECQLAHMREENQRLLAENKKLKKMCKRMKNHFDWIWQSDSWFCPSEAFYRKLVAAAEDGDTV